MSKMKELWAEEQDNAYSDYLESLNQEFRKEGAEELRISIIRELEYSIRGATDTGVRYGLTVALEYVKNANI
jgi:hypothetical protein